MPSIRKLKTRLLSLRIAYRNRQRQFGFGNAKYCDFIAAAVRTERAGQGKILGRETAVFTDAILGKNKFFPTSITALAFSRIQSLFQSSSVEDALKPWTVLGFMSDSLTPNGLAGVLHDKNESIQFINVTAGAFFRALYSAYHVLSFQGFEPKLPGRGKYRVIQVPKDLGICADIHVPDAVERRMMAMRFAVAALKVVFFHELAHVLRGHTVYLNRKYNSSKDSTIVEVDLVGGYAALNIDLERRAIETDADEFCGRFMARQMFQTLGKTEITLESPKLRARAFEILVGTVLTYSWFAETDGYHSGTTRAVVVLGSMFAELGIDTTISSKWIVERVDALQDIMYDLQLLPYPLGLTDQNQLKALRDQTLAYRDANMREWLACRPWPNASRSYSVVV